MYRSFKNSIVEVVGGEELGGTYHCNVPPLGYGINVVTGLLEKVDIIKRSNKKEEQYWERELLPKDYIKKRKAEELEQEENDEYVDPELEEIRQRHWHRRLCGCWVYINGKPTYLTQLHWFYLQHWQIDIGYPQYREPDRKFFYILLYCILDPRCCGLLEATKRRQGKTYRGGCFVYEDISRTKESEGGLQSKTATDSRDVVFKKAIISPFKKLVDFFRPVFDTSKGLTPTSELKFAHTTKKGRRALEDIDKPELNSLIDWASSEVYAYDGRKKRRIFEDEIGKTQEANIYDRHNVVRYCLETDGEWTGFKLGSTTVEDMASGGAEFLILWNESDMNKRDDNGHTISGMYRIMTPAYETLYFNKFGNPDVEKAKEYYLNRRNGLQNNPRTLASEIRKNPFNVREMFFVDGDSCLYDAMKLNIQLDKISWGNYTERGVFEWKDGERFTEVIWRADKQGRFEICRGFQIPESNRVVKRNDNYYPNNNFSFAIGCDPFKYDKTKDSRRSDCAALVYKKFDAADKTNIYNDVFVCKYKYRAATTGMQYEDILKMAWYFGCQILFESNVDNWKNYFKEHGCYGFLMVLPGETEPGLYSDGHGKAHQQICDYTESYINNNIDKVFFKDLIKEWLDFKIEDTTKFDLAMSAGYTLIAAREKIYKRTVSSGREITDYFPKYKAS